MGVCEGDTTLHPKRAMSDHTTSHIHSTQESTGHTAHERAWAMQHSHSTHMPKVDDHYNLHVKYGIPS